MRRSGVTAGALAVLVLGAVPVRAQEEPPPPPIRPPDADRPPDDRPVIDVTAPGFRGFALGDHSENVLVGDERMFAAAGTLTQPVLVRFAGFELRCEGLVMWGDRDRLQETVERRRESLLDDPDKILGPVVHAIYAEGQVSVDLKGQRIRADRVFLDFERAKAFYVRAKLTADLAGRRGRPVPLVVRADVIRATSRNTYRAENARFTTCTYSDPHYEFATDWIEVEYKDAFATFETDWWPSIRMDTLAGEDTTVFAFPKLGGNSTLASTPIQGFSAGGSSRFGTTVEVTWGGDIQRADGSKWGDWRLHTDHRSARGPGAGVDLTHEGEDDELDFSAYWQRDGEEFDDFSDRNPDGGLDPRGRKNRGFVHLFHRWFVEDAAPGSPDLPWRIDTEVSWYSDRGYLPEYRSRLLAGEKQQETYVQARRTWGNEGVSLLASYRLNDEAAALNRLPGDLLLTDYENQTQYLPSLSYHVISEPILTAESTGLFPVNLSLQASAANVKRRYDERLASRFANSTGWRAEHVLRGDLEGRVNAPFSVGPVVVNPAFGGSLYAVDEANGFLRQEDGSNGRSVLFGGVRADTQFWRLYPGVRSDLFALDGLRHVVSFDVQYLDRFHVSDEPLGFQGNDLVDEIVEQRIASLRMRNRLQTKRDGEVEDWFDHEVRFLHFFEETDVLPTAGLFGVREDFPRPLQDLDFPGETKYASSARDGSAYWQHRARLRLAKNVWLVGELDHDIERGATETSAAGIRWFVDDRMSLYLGRRSIHDDSAIWTGRFDYRLSNRWGVGLEHQQETISHRALRTALSLYRRAHDYTIAVELLSDKQRDETSLGLALYPNVWGEGRTDPFSLRRPLDHDAMKWYR